MFRHTSRSRPSPIYVRRSRLLLILGLAVLAATAATTGRAQAAEVPVYRETFNLPEPNTGDLSSFGIAEALGWFGRRNGGSAGYPDSEGEGLAAPLEVFGSRVCPDLRSIGNDPVFDGSGRATWTSRVAGVTLWTEEFAFDAGLLTRISFQMTHDAGGSNNRLALLIDDTWYISDQSFSYAGPGCEEVSFNLATTTFGTSPVILPGDASACSPEGVPCGPFQPRNSGIALPTSGTVDGFGIFIDRVPANHRFDNYTVYATFDALGQCISTLKREQCFGLSKRDRAKCNRQQVRTCFGLFGEKFRRKR